MTSEYSDVTLPSYANLLDYSPAKVEQPQPTEAILVPRECIFDIKQGLHLTPLCTHFYHPDTIQCPEGLHKLMTFQHGCPHHCRSPGRMCFLNMSTKMSSRHGDHQASNTGTSNQLLAGPSALNIKEDYIQLINTSPECIEISSDSDVVILE